MDPQAIEPSQIEALLRSLFPSARQIDPARAEAHGLDADVLPAQGTVTMRVKSTSLTARYEHLLVRLEGAEVRLRIATSAQGTRARISHISGIEGITCDSGSLRQRVIRVSPTVRSFSRRTLG